MRTLLGFLVLGLVKTFSKLFYMCDLRAIGQVKNDPWDEDVRLIVFLNHTSLYEPLFLQVLPFRFLWRLSTRASVPAADVTLKRPIVGRFWKLMLPNIVSVTRRSDSTWEDYVDSIQKRHIVLIAPEGRMKRPNGLDKFGKKMTIRGGVADIIMSLDEGVMLLCLSGGLHHVQSPGQHFPRLFKRIEMNYECLDLKTYRNKFPEDFREQKLAIVQDLQRRLENDCPGMKKT